ncbi:MAG: hypothetical protein GXZ11_03665 [Tissierellia bacterium]|nr:hypothetical protein [Tissierellia bacterium]
MCLEKHCYQKKTNKEAIRENGRGYFLFIRPSSKQGGMLAIIWIILAVLFAIMGSFLYTTRANINTLSLQRKYISSYYRSEGLIRELWDLHSDELLSIINRNLSRMDQSIYVGNEMVLSYPYDSLELINLYSKEIGMSSQISLVSTVDDVSSGQRLELELCPAAYCTKSPAIINGLADEDKLWINELMMKLPNTIESSQLPNPYKLFIPETSSIILDLSDSTNLVVIDGNNKIKFNRYHGICIYSPNNRVDIEIVSGGSNTWNGMIITKGDVIIDCSTVFRGLIWLLDGQIKITPGNAMRVEGQVWMNEQARPNHALYSTVNIRAVSLLFKTIPELMDTDLLGIRSFQIHNQSK